MERVLGCTDIGFGSTHQFRELEVQPFPVFEKVGAVVSVEVVPIACGGGVIFFYAIERCLKVPI